MSVRLPDFFIIGAPKCATTSLYQYLTRHPYIFLCTPKEPQFFSDVQVFSKGIAWYQSLFKQAGDAQICGDASTTYARWPTTPDVPLRILNLRRFCKFIYVMRNPVDRAYSEYAHHMRTGLTATFEERLRVDKTYIQFGLYFEQITRYLRFFPVDSFLFLFFEDFVRHPQTTLERIQDFLGVPRVELIQANPIKANARGPDEFIRSRTTKRLRRIAGLNSVIDMIPPCLRDETFRLLKASPVGKRLAAQFRLPEMRLETRKRLIDVFEKPNRNLAKFLSRDLQAWSDF